MLNDFTQGCGARHAYVYRSLEMAVKILLFEAKVPDVEIWLVTATLTNRVGLGEQMAAGSVVIDHVQDVELLKQLLGHLLVFKVLTVG